uniref:Voltage-dependent T-type calcium channel subunit alpha-1H n=1 Tax=Pelusios castaneus TaxID=367368 RepID=A0A8C8RPA8_9SAUR
MTKGPPLASDEVRVPIASLPSQAAQPGEDEDVLSACKSIQSSLGSGGSSARDPAQEDEEQVPYPALAPTVFFCLKQTTRPRSWCLKLVCNPYPSCSGALDFHFYCSDYYLLHCPRAPAPPACVSCLMGLALN